jgi:hypothetical protein
VGSAPNQYEVIATLIDKGWIPLRQMAVLLGYKELRGIYARQRGKNAIPTIRIGGTERVYLAEAITTLETVREDKQDEAKVILSLLRMAQRTKEKKRA